MRRYHITVGAKTTVDGTVRTGWECSSINGQFMAREGDDVYCPECDSIGKIALDGPRLDDRMEGRQAALEGDLCSCKCDPQPKLIANQTIRSQWIEVAAAPQARAATQPAATPPTAPPPAAPRASGFAPRPSPFSGDISAPTCMNMWFSYQRQAEAIVAPGGVLIADPKERNRAINAAYARLWLEDNRFQWAGLAAFASKQVGCGLLHAADAIEKIQIEHEANVRLKDMVRRNFRGLFDEREREETPEQLEQAKRELEQAKREYEQANRNNKMPRGTLEEGEAQSSNQQHLQYVHDMLALGNTTLFLDVFPLHAFFKAEGLEALKTCLRFRSVTYGVDQAPAIWPVGQATLKFGTNHVEILKAFEAIEAGNIARSVVFLASHEQINILQPIMYNDPRFVLLLRGNHIAYVTGLPVSAQPIELTLASQCRRVDDESTIGFARYNPIADLSILRQRMAFVLRAAAQFDTLLHGRNRHSIEQAIRDIANGGGVR